MGLTTPRYALRYPVLADPNDPPADLLNLATDLDNKMSTFSQAVISSRPAAALSGRFFFATDTKDVSYDTGAAWRSLTGAPVIPVGRYYLTTAAISSGTTFAVLPWNQTDFNRNGMPTYAVATPKQIVPLTGYWRMRAQARWTIPSAGSAVLQIRKGPNSDTAGTVIAYAQRSANVSAGFGANITVEVETTFPATAGDDFAVWHGASPTSTLQTGITQTFVELTLVSVT